MKNLLVISNGHGEDNIASNIVKKLLSTIQVDVNVKVLPIVGLGKAYESMPVEIVGPRQRLPSGGFLKNSLKNLWQDIKSGVIGLTFSQIAYLRSISSEIDLVMVVGDVYALILAGLFIKTDIIFLPTAKSEYINGHYFIEKLLMEKMASIVLPRDQKTADNLKKSGINVYYAGNVMMDCFTIKGIDYRSGKSINVIGILPGSREEAYDNLLDILAIIRQLEEKITYDITYLVAVASNLSLERFKEKIGQTPWLKLKPEKIEKENGINLKLTLPDRNCMVKLIYHHFGDIINQSDLIIGLAGTANEQAAGLGKPVITFPGCGSQFTKHFAREQKKLLGDSVAFLDNDPDLIANKVIDILDDKKLYKKMSETGRERMGKPGAIGKIVNIVISYLE